MAPAESSVGPVLPNMMDDSIVEINLHKIHCYPSYVRDNAPIGVVVTELSCENEVFNWLNTTNKRCCNGP